MKGKHLLLSSIISAPVLADATTPAADSTTEKTKSLSQDHITKAIQIYLLLSLSLLLENLNEDNEEEID